ncbi:polymorphic toxin-type HINT domain-containing protein [Actinorugispora endophytica]|uniref:polymorphic toxin-type HINT domain-containing protein n=1 Tax=Actinorugispora endophytica TaxID=1605990 RepID=UPI001060C981|nr:polymorphic toxin-type HINT domain-containing protein [Actinorugispora endophytica]
MNFRWFSPSASRCRETVRRLIDIPSDWNSNGIRDADPFWVPEAGQWIDAGDLTPGTWLHTSAGTWVQVTAVRKWTQTTTAHNLTVENLHTYHVLAGQTPVLVHNSGGCPTVGLLSPSHQAVGDSNARGGIYALVSENGTVMRTGMATDLQSRLATHRRNYPGLTGVVLYRTDNRAARRGLEEMVENWYTPILANQRAIRLDNPRRQGYLQATRDFLDQWR